jgi:hypothetical protein
VIAPLAAAVLTAATLLTIASSGSADFKVTEAPETCSNAHALLVASESGKHRFVWREIGRVATSSRDNWEVVDDYQPGVMRKISFRQYQVNGNANKTAYVVHCGHGGTCNKLAQAFFKVHSDWYSPTVFCGEVPSMLHSPSQPDLADL